VEPRGFNRIFLWQLHSELLRQESTRIHSHDFRLKTQFLIFLINCLH